MNNLQTILKCFSTHVDKTILKIKTHIDDFEVYLNVYVFSLI